MADRQLFNPFPGLRPFGAEEDYLFFGREEQTRELLQLLRTHRFLAVVGTSGSGKSSLVRAGLLPALYGGTMVGVGSDWSTVVFRPGGDPLLNLAEAMIEADLYDPEDDEAPLRIRATLSRSRLGLVQSVKQSDLPEGTNLLIVVDQFEELFRFRDTSEEHQSRATAFVKLLLNAVADPELPIYVAITMRSDYLGDCAQLPGLAEAVNDGEYLIPKLTRDQKRDAIEKPVSVGGGQISPALVQQLLNDVGDDSDQLPILQHVLMRIWDKWELDQNAAGSIDLSHYDSVGGMNNALSLHADEVHDDLPDDDSRQLSMRLFQAITERGDDERGIRRPTRMDQLCEIVDGSPEEVAVVLDAYRQAGRTFVMPGQDVELNSETVVDISHESLMRVWQRLKGWVAEESQAVRIYRRLAETAALHAEDAAGVYRDPDLQIATSWRDNSQPTEAWAHRYHAGFTTAMEFLDKSWTEAHAEEEAREAARKRELEQARKLAESERKRAEVQAKAKKRVDILLAGISVALLIAVGMYLYAEKQREIAEKNEELARTALDDKETSERQLKLKQRTDDLATAQAMFEQGNVVESLRSLQDACKREPTEPALLRPAMRYISQHNFFSATDAFNLQRRFAKDARVFPLKSLRGLAIAGKNGDLLLMSQGRSSPATTKFDAAVVQCAVAEKHLQVLTADGTVHCWWPDEDRQLSIHKQLEDEAGFPATFPANSVTFVAGHIAVHSGQTLWLIAMDQNQSPLIVKRFTLEASQSILRAAVTTDLTRAFLVDQDEHYRLIDLVKEPTEIRSFPAQSEVIFMTELPLQGKLMSVEREGLIHLVDAMDPKLDMVLDVENAATSVKHILVSPDSTRLAILSQSGDIGVFNLADGEPFFTQQENKSFQFEVIRFDPSGVAIAGTDRDGHLTAIDSETGQQLVVPSVVKVIPGSFYVAQPLDSDGRPQAGLFVGGLPYRPRLVQWKLVMRLPNQADLLPQGDAIRQRTLSSGFSALFCNYWIGRISGFGRFQGAPGSPVGRGIDYGPMQNFTRAVIERETQQPSRFFNPEALANYWSEQAASGKPLSLARAVLSSQLTPKVLAASMTMASPEQTGNLSARYHQIHFLRQHFQLADDEEFSVDLLQRLAQYPSLLEARSMAHDDQRHVGPTLALDNATHIGSWDGLKSRFTIEEGIISTPQKSAPWPGTNNQWVIWRGADFSDFRLRVRYLLTQGDTGAFIRGVPADDASLVPGARSLHEYLQKGYQANLMVPGSGIAGMSGAQTSYGYGRNSGPIALAGEHAVTRRSGQLKRRRLSPTTPSRDAILAALAHGENTATLSVEARRHRIDLTDNDLHLNTSFDFHNLRRLSGSISIQSLNVGTAFRFSSIEVNRLGRDLADAELNRTAIDREDLEPRLVCDILQAQKRWDELAAQLKSILAADEGGDWANTMLRDVNIRRRNTQRRLARACLTNDVKSTRQIIDEVSDPALLNRLAHENVGEIGQGTFLGTPALVAATRGSLDVLKLLVENGLQISQPSGTHGFVVAAGAAISNQPAILKYLLEQGCDPGSVNRYGFALLQEAARWSGPECVKMLLDAGATIDQGSSDGLSAIQLVTTASVDIKDVPNPGEDRARWIQYARSERRLEVARLLIEGGLKPDTRYGDRPSAIERAVELGDTKFAEFLKSQMK